MVQVRRRTTVGVITPRSRSIRWMIAHSGTPTNTFLLMEALTGIRASGRFDLDLAVAHLLLGSRITLLPMLHSIRIQALPFTGRRILGIGATMRQARESTMFYAAV